MTPLSGMPRRRRDPGPRAAISRWLALTLLAIPIAVLPAAALGAASDGESAEERRIETLEREVERLRAALEALRAGEDGTGSEERLAEIERRLAILAEEIERLSIGDAAARAEGPQHGMGPAASKIYRTEKGVSIGGYGEALYQGFDGRRDDGSPSEATDELDLLRAVVYFGYKFNDRWLLNSEIEYEHAGDEVGVEFAYVEYRHGPAFNVRAGLLLPPMGFINELHEPTVYLGALRPETERAILPTTWRETGAGVWGETDHLAYRAYVVSSFDAAGFDAGGLREGRQEGSEAKAEDIAFTGRLDYVGTPGLLAGISLWRGAAGQDLEDAGGRRIEAVTTLLDAHLEYRYRGLELRALGVWGEVDDVAALNDALGLAGSESIGEELEGLYLQAGYDVFAGGGPDGQSLTPYLRWETLDTQAKVPSGFSRDPRNDREILTVGVAWQPIDPIVLKVDWQDRDDEAGTGVDQVNVLLGYIF